MSLSRVEVNKIVDAIVAHPDAVVISQQRGEAEPPEEDVRLRIKDLLERKPEIVLQKWGHLLQPDVLAPFQTLADNYGVQFYLKELSRTTAENAATVRNRRFQHMQRLMEEGIYFSETEMKQRAPWLYQQFVGQHLTEEEVQQQVAESSASWATQLMAHMEGQQARELLEVLQEQAGYVEPDEPGFGGPAVEEDEESSEFEVEEDEDSESEDDDRKERARDTPMSDVKAIDHAQSTMAQVASMQVTDLSDAASVGQNVGESKDADQRMDDGTEGSAAVKTISDEERARLRNEFLQLMQERFIRGDDKDFFNYADIDRDQSLDNLTLRARDEQEAYFDAD